MDNLNLIYYLFSTILIKIEFRIQLIINEKSYIPKKNYLF